MPKIDVVAAQKAAILAAQDLALEAGLGACYDQGLVDQAEIDAPMMGGDVTAAVQAATAPLLAQIEQLTASVAASEQALIDAKALAAEELAALQVKFDALALDEQMDQKVIDSIKSLLFPAV